MMTHLYDRSDSEWSVGGEKSLLLNFQTCISLQSDDYQDKAHAHRDYDHGV